MVFQNVEANNAEVLCPTFKENNISNAKASVFEIL